MQRTTYNGVAGGFTGFAGVGIALHVVGLTSNAIEFFGLIQAGWFNPVAGLMLVFFCGSGLLIARNFDLAQGLYRRWRRSRCRAWDMPVCDAVNHIAFFSHAGVGMTDREKVHLAFDIFCERAQRGDIRVSGTPPGTTLPCEIKPREWLGATLDQAACLGQRNFHGTGGIMVCANEEKTIRYQSLRVDKDEIERVWPHRRGQHGWMAQ